MGPVAKLTVSAVAGLLFFPIALQPVTSPSSIVQFAVPRATSRFAQSAIQILDREFTSHDLSFLLFDAQSGVLLLSRWDDSSTPIPLGSLVKPFTALAYAETHAQTYPTLICRGAASGCWQVHPHGKLDIVSAIAVSCNSYFSEMAAQVSAEQIQIIANRFEMDAPAANLMGPDLMGLGSRWQISPLKMSHAYIELYRRRDQPGVQEIIAGLEQSTRRGTGAGVGRALKYPGALVKTGTAPCTHVHSAPADGFVVAMVPAKQPEILLMIRVHGVPGAKAAETAGRMLRRMEE